MSFQKKLSDIFNPLDPSKNIYQSVEIRAVFVLEESTHGLPHNHKRRTWLNLFTIMRFTPHPISNPSAEVQLDGQKVKFVIWKYPFKDIWNRLIYGFSNGTILLDPIAHRDYDPRNIVLSAKYDLLGQFFSFFPVYRENYHEEWPVMIKTYNTSSIDQSRNIFRNDFEISHYIQSVTFETHETALREFLKINISPDQTDNFHMIFKIPYKIDKTKIYSKNGQIFHLNVGIVSDGLDAIDLTVHIRQKTNSETLYKTNRPLNAAKTYSDKKRAQNGLLLWEVKDQLKNDPNSRIEVDLFHKELGTIETKVKSFNELLITDDMLQRNIPVTDPFTEISVNNEETIEGALGFEDLLDPLIYTHAYHHYKNGNLRDAVLNSIIAVFDLIRERTGLKVDGQTLVSEAFSLDRDKTKLIFSELETESGKNDQKGFLQILIGAYLGIRNPKAHTLQHNLNKKAAAQYLVFASLLARRVSEATQSFKSQNKSQNRFDPLLKDKTASPSKSNLLKSSQEFLERREGDGQHIFNTEDPNDPGKQVRD